MYEPYQDRPVMGTSTVEMVIEDVAAADGGGLDLGDDPDMLSDFGETDHEDESDEFLIPGGSGHGDDIVSSAKISGSSSNPSAVSSLRSATRSHSSSPAPSSSSSFALTSASSSSSSMACSYCLNVLYVPAMFGM